jgi:serine/threonine protein kinase
VAAARAVSGVFTAAVVDADPLGQRPWLATEYVRGPSLLAAVTRHGPLPAASAAALGAGVVEALAAVHQAGLVHRDLKPSNILLAAEGPKVIDFGIARSMEANAATRTAGIIGTPAFMAPEQAGGPPEPSPAKPLSRAEWSPTVAIAPDVTPAADVFALGGVLTFATTGYGPFGHGSVPELLMRVVYGQPDIGHVPASLRDIVYDCLDKDPTRRPTLDQILDRLTDAVPNVPDLHHPGWLPPTLTQVILATPSVPPDAFRSAATPAGGVSWPPHPTGQRASASQSQANVAAGGSSIPGVAADPAANGRPTGTDWRSDPAVPHWMEARDGPGPFTGTGTDAGGNAFSRATNPPPFDSSVASSRARRTARRSVGAAVAVGALLATGLTLGQGCAGPTPPDPPVPPPPTADSDFSFNYGSSAPYNCNPKPRSLRDSDTAPTTITFVNNRSEQIQIFEHDQYGNRLTLQYSTLPPGKQTTISTYTTYAYEVADDALRCQEVFVPAYGGSTVVVR